MRKHPMFKFFSSLKLAVFSILSLAVVLAYATVFESFYGMRAVHVAVYGTWWFSGVLFMLGVNVLCAALSRYPWKKHQLGFVTTHAGILIILGGSLLTQQLGVDGNMPVNEASEENEVILNDLRLSVNDESQNRNQEFPIRDSYREVGGDWLRVDFGNAGVLRVDRYLPRAIAEKKIEASPIAGMGLPSLRIEVYNDRFRLEESLLASQPSKPTELNLGPAIIHFQKLWNAADEKEFFNPKKLKEVSESKGYVVAALGGKEYRIAISEGLKKWLPVGGNGLEMKVERYLPYAVVEKNELVTRSQEPVNPAVQLVVRQRGTEGPENEERHTLFANFPEFATMHGAHHKKVSSGLKLKMQAVARGQNEIAIVGSQRGRMYFAQSVDDTKLYYRVLAKDGTTNGQGEIVVGQVVPTGWMDLQFKITEWLPSAIEREVPRSVEYISGSGDNYLSAIHILEPGQQESKRKPSMHPGIAPGFWLFEGMGKLLNIDGREVFIQYHKQKLTLPFHMHLDKFKMGTDPGTSKAATYESDVVVKDLKNAIEKKANISMNEPLKYGGYTFYQASYSLEEGRPPVSVFAVNYDPGRAIKYLGSICMVLGILIMFYMNPHYLSLIFNRKGNTR